MVDNVISILKPFNRPHKPDAATADFLYRVYRLLLESPASMTPHARKRTFEAAADGAHSWAVVCISEKALEKVAVEGSADGLKRAHALSREVRFQTIFGPDAQPMAKDQLMAYFFQHDTCALVISDENNKDTTDQWSRLYEVPKDLPGRKNVMFRSFPGSFSVYARKTVEVPWAQKLWEQVKLRA